jgi:hypothetical protein
LGARLLPEKTKARAFEIIEELVVLRAEYGMRLRLRFRSKSLDSG